MQGERIRVPLFTYFAIVTPVLLGFLFAAEAVLGPPAPMRFSADAPAFSSSNRQIASTKSSVPILTVRQSIAPPPSALHAPDAAPVGGIASAANAQAHAPTQLQAKAQVQPAAPAPAKKKVAKAAEPKKKATKVVQASTKREAKGDRVAFAPPPRFFLFGNIW